MDAISFVLGIKSSHLRSNQLKELVYNYQEQDDQINLSVSKDKENIFDTGGGALTDMDMDEDQDKPSDMDMNEDQDKPSSCKVTIHYMKNNGKNEKNLSVTTLFSRAVLPNGSSEYRIDHKVVNYQAYLKVLEKENVLVKARNFLVFQGDVEAVASQSPKDLTLLIETISGYETLYF